MKALVWVIRFLLFALLFVLALRNTAEVSLVLPWGEVWNAPLILIALAFFAAGMALVALAMAPRIVRHRLAAYRLRRQMDRMQADRVTESSAAPTDAPHPISDPRV